MPSRVTLFITSTIAVGMVFVSDSLYRVNISNLALYAACLALALFTSTLKVRLPGITGTISVNFLFILISTAVFSLPETVLLASAACVVQCLWKTRKRPKALQVAFNVSTLAISSSVTYRAAHLLSGSRKDNLTVLLSVAVCSFFATNTCLVSGVLSLVEGKPFVRVWRQCYLWSFPYYLAGAAIAGVVVFSSREVGWITSFLILPLMYQIYLFYRTFVERMVQHSPALTAV